LAVRLREHKNTFKEGLLDKYRLAQHAYEEDHKVDWDGARILSFEENIIRKYKESVYMSWEGNSISQPSLEFSPIWSPLISNMCKKYWILLFTCLQSCLMLE
jgi:hypothetical protein